jgi:hypothetical protein
LEQTSRQHGWLSLSKRAQLVPSSKDKLPIERSLDDLDKNRRKSLAEVAPLEQEFADILTITGKMKAELAEWDRRVEEAQAEWDAAQADCKDNATPEAVDALRRAGDVLMAARQPRDTLREYLSNPRRYKELALGLAQVQELRYRALGDNPTPGGAGAKDAGRTLQQIVVNLPAVVTEPRKPVIQVETTSENRPESA